MAGEEAIKEFPHVNHKLAAPKKLSAFEKERQAADEKRRRAEAEDAAALKAFQDSFAQEDEDDLAAAVRGRGPPLGPRGAGAGYGGSGRGYGMTPMGPRNGPGSLGSAPGMGPPSLKRKRALDEMREAQQARREQALLGHEDSGGDIRHAPHVQEGDREDDPPRPTMQLSQLPPDMTREKVELLLKNYVEVHSIQLLPPIGPGPVGNRSLSAIASLATETSTAQIETAVSALKDKYLGCGFYLSISRHLSSTALHPSMAATSTSVEPFGAERPKEPSRMSMHNAPPPPEHRDFAPPESYDSPVRGGYGMPVRPEAVVNVQPPLDVNTIRAIHVLVERLMTEPSPKRAMKLEAVLMAMPEVQKDERFAFLYDSRSPAGVYYRYLLWGPEDPSARKQRARGLERIHDDKVMEWALPHGQVPFLDLTSLADVVTDIDYVSSDEESEDEGGERRFYDGRDADGPLEPNKKEHLNPVKRARLVHLLSRLPTSNARLRKGDIARTTNFAINHAGQGAEEVVDLLLLNVAKPFSYSLAAKYEASDEEQDEEDEYEPDDSLPTLGAGSPQPLKDSKREQDDPSNAKLIALYVISDILSASSTAGARNAWKYRQLFESGFGAQKTFEHLGKLDKELAWGRLKAEQWKRRVGAVFGIWEGWSVFSGDVHEELKQSFFEPPLSEEGKRAEQEAKEVEERKKQEEKWKGKFRRVGQNGSPAGSASPAPAASVEEKSAEDDVDGQPMDDIDGVPMDEEVDSAPMEDVDRLPMSEDVDGAPMDGIDGAPMDSDGAPAGVKPPSAPKIEESASLATATSAASASKPSVPKRRMRAEDMFASDEEFSSCNNYQDTQHHLKRTPKTTIQPQHRLSQDQETKHCRHKHNTVWDTVDTATQPSILKFSSELFDRIAHFLPDISDLQNVRLAGDSRLSRRANEELLARMTTIYVEHSRASIERFRAVCSNTKRARHITEIRYIAGLRGMSRSDLAVARELEDKLSQSGDQPDLKRDALATYEREKLEQDELLERDELTSALSAALIQLPKLNKITLCGTPDMWGLLLPYRVPQRAYNWLRKWDIRGSHSREFQVDLPTRQMRLEVLS